MTFLISETFIDSLARLTGEEQKAAKTTAFDLQLNSDNHLDRTRQERKVSMRSSGGERRVGQGQFSGRPVETGRPVDTGRILLNHQEAS